MKFLKKGNILLLGAFILILSGCGIRLFKGSDESASTGPQTGGISIRIVWPENNDQRLIPSATNSVKIRIMKGTNVVLTDVIPREAGEAEVKKSYKDIPVGDVIFEASAYASQDGTGVALARGSATVQITLGEYAQVSITMASTITKVEVTPAEATLSVGETLQLTATAKDADGNIVLVPEGGFSWQSSNPAVAEVDEGGKVTAKSEGSATITAREKESGKSGSASIKVETAPSVITFEKTFGGSSWDEGYSVAETKDGGYIIVGITWSFGAGKDDVYLIKTDSQGNKVWEKTFGGSSWDEGHCVVETKDGGYIIVGETDSFGAGGGDVYLIKTDSQGNKVWEKTFGGSEGEWGYSVAETKDGGYIIV
ncbi:Ig-like domain-containing protein, partial [bacterium]|nr:Ig-like domain-containing protein [bacterium]